MTAFTVSHSRAYCLSLMHAASQIAEPVQTRNSTDFQWFNSLPESVTSPGVQLDAHSGSGYSRK